ncbi:MAG: endonuclease/exonuclease/phosphatase family protein [Ignavibacteriales bacterium]|nr:endonuclease/exonuclease/phosphatase family protein [Ignavibacteriales bacterium]
MLRSLYIIFIAIFVGQNLMAQNSLTRIMTYNIRYANNNPGEEWNVRRDKVIEMIRFHDPKIFGVQEALIEQVADISSNFPEYQLVGVGRDDGHIQGEFSALFISPEFNVIDQGTFWLSETPDTPSVGWDASLNRIATWALVVCSKNQDTLFVMDTHFDHLGVTARLKSAELLVSKIQDLNNGFPSILMGDFNFTSDFEGYKIIVDSGILNDADKTAEFNYGTSITFNGFKENLERTDKIDYIFISPEIKVKHHAVIGEKFQGQYPSDHMPVIIDFYLK